MPEPTPEQLIFFIRERFDLAELEDLCLQLEVNYDDLEGSTRREKARKLVQHMQRRERLPQLREAVGRERPEAYAKSFPAPPGVVGEPAPPVAPSAPEVIRRVVAEPAPPVEPPVSKVTNLSAVKRVPIWALALSVLAVVALAVWASMAFNERNNGRTDDVTPTASRVVAKIDEASPMPEPSSTQMVTPLPEPKAGHIRTVMRGGIAVEQVFVPAGSFMMGNEYGFDNERPVHEVILDAFWIDLTEVTNAQFAAFVADTGYETTAERKGGGFSLTGTDWEYTVGADWRHPNGPGSDLNGLDEHPVVLVSWDDATAYSTWAGGRLPTEAEWEYAARGPESLVYPWGNTFNVERLNYCDQNCPFGWADQSVDDGYRFAAPVGTYPGGASWVGARDMSGNVWEWVNDWYDSGYYERSPDVNPPGPDTGKQRALRGGSWDNIDQHARATYRLDALQDHRNADLGFRVAEPLSDPDS